MSGGGWWSRWAVGGGWLVGGRWVARWWVVSGGRVSLLGPHCNMAYQPLHGLLPFSNLLRCPFLGTPILVVPNPATVIRQSLARICKSRGRARVDGSQLVIQVSILGLRRHPPRLWTVILRLHLDWHWHFALTEVQCLGKKLATWIFAKPKNCPPPLRRSNRAQAEEEHGFGQPNRIHHPPLTTNHSPQFSLRQE